METTPPVEPADWTLARIEAQAALYRSVPHCPDCQSWPEPLMTGEELPRAIGIRHEPTCPVVLADESQPAAEYVVTDLNLGRGLP